MGSRGNLHGNLFFKSKETRGRGRGKGEERGEEISVMLGFIPQMPLKAGVGPGQSQEPGARNSTLVSQVRGWDPSS